jgi:hypothetical protein
MNIEECNAILFSELHKTVIAVPENSPLGRAAAAVLEMAHAYRSDSSTFYTSHDPVNALAGCYYGFGWLHFGISFGLLACKKTVLCPFSGSCGKISDQSARKKLEEKTARYASLLDTARSSVICSPDPSTQNHDFAERVLCISAQYAEQGRRYMKAGSFEDALACFSYGHGWLDTGVAAGLFSIVAAREIFTV